MTQQIVAVASAPQIKSVVTPPDTVVVSLATSVVVVKQAASAPPSVVIQKPVPIVAKIIEAPAIGVMIASGVPGPPGPAGLVYRFTQATASTTWVIPHGFGRTPLLAVTVGGAHYLVDAVDSDDLNTTTITWLSATAGTAVCE